MNDCHTSSLVKVVMKDFENNPHCPHGPTLQFVRITNSTEKNYYACSACRDRKYCNFFMLVGKKLTKEKQEIWKQEAKRILPKINHKELVSKFNEICRYKDDLRIYCQNCNEFILKSERRNHQNHRLIKNITDYQMRHPSELLQPLECSKKEAQYFFTNKSTKDLIRMLQYLKVKHVVSVCSPRIHENIVADSTTKMNSILLDFDHRFHNFYDENQFCWYNCFNYHFFWGDESVKRLSNFLQQDKGLGFVIFFDPPFGGLIEPLTYSLNKIKLLHKQIHSEEVDIPVIWIFPYFMESEIKFHNPNINMLDYQVKYDNYSCAKGNKQSPVRIFTDIPPKQIVFNNNENHWFCKICERWSSLENKHCKLCEQCTTKHGNSYIHCKICNLCVKPSWNHCSSCKACRPRDHKCFTEKPNVMVKLNISDKEEDTPLNKKKKRFK